MTTSKTLRTGYRLGIDLGTTYTAAAIQRDGRVTMTTLGTRNAEIATVIAYPEDGELLVGEPAERRAASQPERIAREFKRRLGDPVPMIVAGVPRSAESLMAVVLRHVIDKVTAAEGEPPTEIVVTHPASWGPYKTSQFSQIFQLAGCTAATTLTEPEAAARHYAAQGRLAPSSTVAVFDFGGGTFDVAILRCGANETYEPLGEARGLERLGGIDIDHAVFSKVLDHLDLDLANVEDSTESRNAIARLRADCVAAKEALSVDTSVTVPVMLPGIHTEVRLNRSEFEDLIRPLIVDAITSVDDTIQTAGIRPADLTAILLVGGSSRIPLVSQLVTAHFGRPTLVDAHPKHSIASGAALKSATGEAPLREDSATRTPPLSKPPAPATNQQIATPSPPADQVRTPPPPAAPLVAPSQTFPLSTLNQRVLLVLATVGLLVAFVVVLTVDRGGDIQDNDAAQASPVSSTDPTSTTSTSAATTIAPSLAPTSLEEPIAPDNTTESPDVSATAGAVLLREQIGSDNGFEAFGIGSAIGSLPEVGPEHPPQLSWQVETRRWEAPVAIGDIVFTAATGEEGFASLTAYDATSGNLIWSKGEPHASRIIVTAKTVSVRLGTTWRFYEPATGELIAELTLPDLFGDAVVTVIDSTIRNGQLLVAGAHDNAADVTAFVTVIDLVTQTALWTFEDQAMAKTTSGSPHLILAADDQTVIVSAPGAVVALDWETGTELWRSTEFLKSFVHHLDNGVLVVLKETGKIQGLDARTGEALWLVEELAHLFASDGEFLFLSPSGDTLQARRLLTGDLVWRTDHLINTPATGPLVVAGGGAVYLLYGTGHAAAFRASSGSLVWSSELDGTEFGSGSGPESAFTADGRLFIGHESVLRVFE